jgi:glutathione S-transferase
MSTKLVLVSHALCPYVQRAAIVLAEKAVAFERRDVDLARKPEWFLKISPLGKTPVLLVDGQAIFESAVICEFLDETRAPRLHPGEAIGRARHRAWAEFASSLLNSIGVFYSIVDDVGLVARTTEIRGRLEQLEAALGAGPWFGGERFSLVDAAFGPVFRYFDVFEQIGEFGFFDGLPGVTSWRTRLAARPSVRDAVGTDYAERLHAFLLGRRSALTRCMSAAATAPVDAYGGRMPAAAPSGGCGGNRIDECDRPRLAMLFLVFVKWANRDA